MKTLNAIIEGWSLGIKESNVPTMTLSMKLGYCGGCGALGTIKIMDNEPYDNYYGKNNYCGYFLTKVMEVCDVTDLNDLKGKPVRAVFRDSGCVGDQCIGIQHFLDGGIFFIPNIEKYEDNLADIFTPDQMRDYERNVDVQRIVQNLRKKFHGNNKKQE